MTASSSVAGHTSLAKGVTATFSASTAFGGIELSENTGRATLTSATITNGGARW